MSGGSGDAAAEAEAALRRAREAGIEAMPIPTPFAVGRVNTYLIEDDPLVLVDSGPNSGKALDELEQALARLGRRIEDIGLVLVTHQHIDHIGLVDIIARRSGAEVAALDRLAPILGRFGEQAEAEDEFAAELMRRHGIPEDVVSALRSVSAAFRAWGSRSQVTRPLADGGELALRDRALQVLHRPGHSPTDTVFWDDERRILVGGDHLIAHISSNPLITRQPDGEGRRHALIEYLASLRLTREMPCEVVLAGHGAPVTDHRTLIDQRFRMHERRAQKILGLIRERPRTGYELAQALWGNVAVTQAYLTLSEVVGHVDLLVEQGAVLEEDRGTVLRYVAT